MLGDINVGTLPEPEALEPEEGTTIEINRDFILFMLEEAEKQYPEMNLIEIGVHFRVASDLIQKQFNVSIEV